MPRRLVSTARDSAGEKVALKVEGLEAPQRAQGGGQRAAQVGVVEREGLHPLLLVAAHQLPRTHGRVGEPAAVARLRGKRCPAARERHAQGRCARSRHGMVGGCGAVAVA